MAELWDRQHADGKWEPILWFGRFQKYLQLGSKLAVYNAERAENGKTPSRSIPGAWSDAAQKWEWDRRFEAWKLQEIQRKKEEFRLDRLRRRERRHRLLEDGFDRLEQMLGEMDFAEASVNELARLFKTLYENERSEFDDEPATRLKLEGEDGQAPTINITLNPVPDRPRPDDDDGD